MANNNYNKDTDWLSKEKRELFCKAVNSIIMTDIKKLDDLDFVLESAQKIVDTAFKTYPDLEEGLKQLFKSEEPQVMPL